MRRTMIDRRNPARESGERPAVSASERRRREPETSHMNDHSEDKTGENGMGNTINKHIRVDETTGNGSKRPLMSGGFHRAG